jgi:hypothetical protein
MRAAAYGVGNGYQGVAGKTVQRACAMALAAIGENPDDLPFAQLYLPAPPIPARRNCCTPRLRTWKMRARCLRWMR